MNVSIPGLLFLTAVLLFPVMGNAQMFWNQAATFDGTSSYVAIPHAPELDITGSFTLECWVRPAVLDTGMLIQKRLGSASEGYSLYLWGNKPAIRTNSGTKLTSSSTLLTGEWSHVAVSYDQPADSFVIYINGFIDTSRVAAAAAPTSSTDTVYLGTGFNGSFHGDMDEVRIWNRVLTAAEISANRRSSLGTTGGVYSGLVFSMTFQDIDASGDPLSFTDWSGNGNTGLNRGVQALDLTNAPMTYITFNESAQFDGSEDYLAGGSSSAVSPTTDITLEAWVYPEGWTNGIIINKGFPSASYRLFTFSQNHPRIVMGSTIVTSTDSVWPGRWTHIAFTYTSSTGNYEFFMNGDSAGSGTVAAVPLSTNSDSLLIGGGIGLVDFNGYIDEVRISSYVKTQDEIRQFMYASIDNSNEPNSGLTNVVYNLDGSGFDNCKDAGPRLLFRGDAHFSHPATVGNTPESPMTRADDLFFTEGYYIKTSDRRIPQSGTSGDMLRDTLYVNRSASINDLNLFVATNHTFEQDLEIMLVAPNGDSLYIFRDWGLIAPADNMITLFDDEADSALATGVYTSFAPRIRPENNMNAAFSGLSSQGLWELRIYDDAGGDTGRLYAWGLQFNNQEETADSIIQIVDVNPAWNLLSLPVDPIDPLKVDLFPGAITSAFTYGLAGYQTADTLEAGKAFWLKFGGGGSYPIAGFDLPGLSVPVMESWNMVGAISSPIAVSSITSNPPGIVTSQFYEYLGLYLTADTLQPGKGYWVKVTQAGTLYLGAAPSADPAARIRIEPISETPPPPPADGETLADVPEVFALSQAYPNPFNATTTIRYQLPVESQVTLKVYDIVGRVVKVLRDGMESAGYKSVAWDASAFSSGAYFYRLEAAAVGPPGETFTQVMKVVLLK